MNGINNVGLNYLFISLMLLPSSDSSEHYLYIRDYVCSLSSPLQKKRKTKLDSGLYCQIFSVLTCRYLYSDSVNIW